MRLRRTLITYSERMGDNHIVMFTANQTLKADKSLVMGAGNALAMKKARECEHACGAAMTEAKSRGRAVFWTYTNIGWIGGFPTKRHWKDKTPLDLLQQSIAELQWYATHSQYTFHLPMPAVANGGMSVEQVWPMIQCLPDNVIVYFK